MKHVLRKYLMVMSIGLMSIGAFAQTDDVRVHWFDGDDFLGGSMMNVSSNGRYAVGNIIEVHSYIWDRTTGETKIIPRTEAGYCEAEDVSNNGVVAGIFSDPEFMDGGKAVAVAGFYRNDIWTSLPGIKGVQVVRYNAPVAKAISDDGTIIGGFTPSKPFIFSTCTWTNGVLDPLLAGTDLGVGAFANAMSGDGMVLGGRISHSGGQGPAVWNKASTPMLKMLADDGAVMGVSPNGKYVTGNVVNEGVSKAFIWSEETGVVYIPKLEGEFPNATGNAVSNDGAVIGYVYKQLITEGRTPFIYKDGVTYDFNEYLSEFYGYTNESGNTFFTPISMSASGKTICGMGEDVEGRRIPWILTIGTEGTVSVNDVADSEVNVWSNGKTVRVELASNDKTNVEVVDMAGRTITQMTMENGQCSINVQKSGVYVVRVGNSAKKVIIK